MVLTPENFSKGMLVDEELLGGVAPDPARPGGYVAFVLRHTSGETLGHQSFEDLESALAAINQVRRPWKYEASGGCGNGNCGNNTNGTCRIGGCGKKTSSNETPAAGATSAACSTHC